jgi:hypothetical protein
MTIDRLVVAGLVWGLLVATTAAFVATEAFKLRRPPVGNMSGDRILSPGCACPQRAARISIRLREADALDVTIVDEEGETVRVLRDGARPGRGQVFFRWNGRDDEGQIVPDGRYRLRVHLVEADRTATFARRIVVDTEPPALQLLGLLPSAAEPGEEVEIRFELGEAARVLVRVDGRRAGPLGRFEAGTREAAWAAERRGQALPIGTYELRLVARDRAGNRSRSTETITLTVSSTTG